MQNRLQNICAYLRNVIGAYQSPERKRVGFYQPEAQARVKRTLLSLLFMAPLVVGGCNNSQQSPTTQPAQAEPIVKTVERGPVKMIVATDKDQITIADKFKLTIQVIATDGVDVKMPQFAEKLNEFQIRDFRERPAIPENGSRRWEQEYTLDIFLSGDYTIPAITARFTDRRKHRTPDKKAVENEISTEPFTIKVNSLLAGEFNPQDFRDIKGTVPLPAEPTRAWLYWTIAISAAAVACALIVWLIRRRKAKQAAPKVLTPYQWALDQLYWLNQENFVEKGRVHEFYFRLTDIVRQYIERQFDIKAPEQTTEEFLAEVKDRSTLNTEHKRLLNDFLQSADLVKFARYQPQASEIEQAFAAAGDFVEQTAQTHQRYQEEAAA